MRVVIGSRPWRAAWVFGCAFLAYLFPQIAVLCVVAAACDATLE